MKAKFIDEKATPTINGSFFFKNKWREIDENDLEIIKKYHENDENRKIIIKEDDEEYTNYKNY